MLVHSRIDNVLCVATSDACQQQVNADIDLLGLVAAGEPGAVLRVWKNGRCLVVGKSLTKNPNFDHASRVMQQAQWPVVQRASGGTIVPHHEGILNISLILNLGSTAKGPRQVFQEFCDTICSGLRGVGIQSTTGAVPGSFCDGAFNLVCRGRKIAGTAQRRIVSRANGANCVLVHGALFLSDATMSVGIANRFYRLLGYENPFRDEAHISCADVVANRSQRTHKMLEGSVIRHLVQAFQERDDWGTQGVIRTLIDP